MQIIILVCHFVSTPSFVFPLIYPDSVPLYILLSGKYYYGEYFFSALQLGSTYSSSPHSNFHEDLAAVTSLFLNPKIAETMQSRWTQRPGEPSPLQIRSQNRSQGRIEACKGWSISTSCQPSRAKQQGRTLLLRILLVSESRTVITAIASPSLGVEKMSAPPDMAIVDTARMALF